MCTETGIKDVYRGVQGACPRRAVTHAGGTAERSEHRAVGMGLKLVYSRGQTKTTNPISQQLTIFFVIWLQILAQLAEIRRKTCLPSFSHEPFRAAKFLAYKYNPNSGSWVTKFTSKWLMMELNCWKWFVWQQRCPWLPKSNNFSGKTLPLRFKGFRKAPSGPWLPINFYFRSFFLNLFS